MIFGNMPFNIFSSMRSATKFSVASKSTCWFESEWLSLKIKKQWHLQKLQIFVIQIGNFGSPKNSNLHQSGKITV